MNLSDPSELAPLLEALLLAAGQPLSLGRLQELFEAPERPEPSVFRAALALLAESCDGRGVEFTEVASGYRLQVRSQYARWVARLWEERPQRYSRAILETLALIAYRQPITRGEIEEVRGVTVSSQIMRTLQDRNWIRVIGYRDVPGRPAMWATTREFLDYFNLQHLSELPPLAEIRQWYGEETVAPLEAAADEAPVEVAAETVAADTQGAELSFRSLLDELDSMEENLKTDFSDLPQAPEVDKPPSGD